MAALHSRAVQGMRPWTEQDFDDILSGHGPVLITSQHGFALGRLIVDEVELFQIATDPAQQRKGFGAALLGQFEALAKTKGARRAMLEVASGNQAARALYAKAGWQQDGIRTDYYKGLDGGYDDAILLCKLL